MAPPPLPSQDFLDKLAHAIRDRKNPQGSVARVLRWIRRILLACSIGYTLLLGIFLALLEWHGEKHWLTAFFIYAPPQAFLLPLLSGTEFLCPEKDPEFQRHVESRKIVLRVRFRPRQIVNTEGAFGDDVVNLLDADLAGIFFLQRAARLKPAGEEAENQRLVCLSGEPDGQPCRQPFAMIQDTGATFGPHKVDLDGWRSAPIWSDPRSCRINMKTLPHRGATFEEVSITEGGRLLLSERLRVPVDVDVLSVYPHAHYLADTVQAWADPPAGERVWLIEIPDWDFDWQDEYRYQEPVLLPKGSTITMRYVYDNSAENPQNPNRPPKRVTYGSGSTDEMGDLWFQLLADDESARVSGRPKGSVMTVNFELDGQPFVLFERGSNTRRVIDDMFAREEVQPRIVMETENAEILKALVSIGMGVTIIPYQAIAREVRGGHLRCMRIEGFSMVRETGWVYGRAPRVPRLVQHMFDALERTLPKLKLAPPPRISRSQAPA